jgi:hypothetical protein
MAFLCRLDLLSGPSDMNESNPSKMPRGRVAVPLGARIPAPAKEKACHKPDHRKS